MDLLERDSDLGVLDAALDDARQGSGSVILLSGEAGIGKTSLVESFAQQHRRDVRILWGARDDLSTPRTLGPFHDIAIEQPGALKDAVVSGSRGEVFDAVLDVIVEGSPPTVLIIEDDGSWEEAATLWAQIGCPYEQAIALMDSEDSQELLESLAIFDELRAAPAAAKLRRRLRQMGVQGVPRGPREATQLNPAGLTRRQVDVLRLVAEGLTNAEIAGRLFVSPKTVDHHVSAVLTKLDVSSRDEAAEIAKERDLV